MVTTIKINSEKSSRDKNECHILPCISVNLTLLVIQQTILVGTNVFRFIVLPTLKKLIKSFLQNLTFQEVSLLRNEIKILNRLKISLMSFLTHAQHD